MGLFEHWPYVNFHDLNLDWIIKEIPKVYAYKNEAQASAEASAESAAASQRSADAALASKNAAHRSELNAAESESNAAESEANAKNYSDHIADPVSGLVTGWLDDHVTPTTPIVDDTLTIQGAAADAKTAGDEITDLKNILDIRVTTWEQGLLAFADGVFTSSATKICSSVLNDTINTISVPSEYDLGLLAWNGSTYIGAWNSGIWTKGTIWAKSFDLSSIRTMFPGYTFRLNLRYADNSNITTSSANVVTLHPSNSIDDISDDIGKINRDLITIENAANNGYLSTPVKGGFVLGGTGNGSQIVASTTDMITPTVQVVEENCVLTTDWTKYQVYQWIYANGSWTSGGWKHADFELNAGFIGRFLVRAVTIHDLTETEQEEINEVTLYSNETNINKRISFLKVDSQRKTGDFISICHQGYSETMNIGENLLAGYPLAKEKGFDYGECDVVLSSDNVVMCCHDSSFVDATTSETIVIADHTAAELKTYDYYGSTIATLDEIMNACKVNGIGLVIDHATNAILPYIFPIVKKYGMQKRVIYLIGWANGNPNYANNLYNSILAFYPKTSVMFMASTSNINEVVTFVNSLVIGNNRVYITLNYSNFNTTDIQSLNESLNGEISLAVWTIDNVNTCKQYMPFVTAITSNKVSSLDIFN